MLLFIDENINVMLLHLNSEPEVCTFVFSNI